MTTFKLDKCLGKGGFGEVWLATMTERGISQQVALKLLLENQMLLNPDAIARLKDEAKLLGRFSSIPTVLRAHGVYEFENRVGVAAEFIDGVDLHKLIPKRTLPLSAAIEIHTDVAEALATMWDEAELAHRDIKPSNIRIRKDGTVVLLDFGIARSPEVTRLAKTRTGHAGPGTPMYMAPERLRTNEIYQQSDVYCLAACLYATLVGRHFAPKGANVYQIYEQLSKPSKFEENHVKKLKTLERVLVIQDAPVIDEVVDLLGKALQYVPEDRPTLRELADALHGLEYGGESLKAWAKRQQWPEPPELESPLKGATIVEGGVVPDVYDPKAEGKTLVPPTGEIETLLKPEDANAPVKEGPPRRLERLDGGLEVPAGAGTSAATLLVTALGSAGAGLIAGALGLGLVVLVVGLIWATYAS